jgi:hypothetical protein
MKFVKLYEDFDLDDFMKNPGTYFHSDNSKEVEDGDYITSYRGIGQVLGKEGDFLRIQLMDGPRNVVRVPYDMVRKIKKSEAEEAANSLPKTKDELKLMNSELSKYTETVVTTDDNDNEVLSGNITSSIEYLEAILIDVISLSKKDAYTTFYPEYSLLVSNVAELAQLILQTTNDETKQNSVDVILDKFYEISN